MPSLPIITALLLALAYPPASPYTAWVVFVALVPLFIFLAREQNQKKIFWITFLGGTIFMSLIMSWLLAAYPLTWLGMEASFLSWAATMAVWLSISAVFGLFLPFFAYAFRRLTERSYRDVLLIPALFVLAEYGRSILMSLFVLGPGGNIGNFWTFGTLGYSMSAFSPLLQTSKFIGLYGLSFGIVLINALVAIAFLRLKPATGKSAGWLPNSFALRKHLVLPLFLLGGWLLAGSAIKLYYPAKAAEQKTVAIIQTNFKNRFITPREEEYKRIETQLRLMAQAERSAAPDIIVLPEGSNLSSYFKSALQEMLAVIINKDRNPLIIDVSMSPTAAGRKETILYITSRDGLTAFTNKSFLIPWGEYLPYWTGGLARLTGFEEWVNAYTRQRRIQPASSPPLALDADQSAIGTVACSGIASPVFYRRLASRNARLLINSASQAIFQKSELFFGEIEAMLRFHAAANNRPLLQSANGGFSYSIDHNGTILKKTPGLGNTIIVDEVRLISTKTPYTIVGEWFLAFSFLTAVGQFLAQRKKPSTDSP